MANQVPGPTTPAGPQPYDYGALLGMVVYDYKPSTEQWKRIFETLWQRGIANYNPLFGAAAGQPVFVEGKWRMAKETVIGAYDATKFDDINAGADRYGYPQWDGEAHNEGYRCTNRARLWEAIQDVPAGIEPGTEESADYYIEISPSTGALEPFRQTLYKGGETCYALGLIWSVPGDPDTIFDSRPFLSPIAAGFNVESGGIRFYDGSEYGEIVNDPLEFTGTISRSGNVINGTPRIIPALRQDVIELRALGESNPALGLIPGKYRIIDALEREDPDHPGDPDYLLHDEMIVEAMEGNRLAKRAYNNTTGKEGLYGLDDGEGGVDTWVEDAGGGTPYAGATYFVRLSTDPLADLIDRIPTETEILPYREYIVKAGDVVGIDSSSFAMPLLLKCMGFTLLSPTDERSLAICLNTGQVGRYNYETNTFVPVSTALKTCSFLLTQSGTNAPVAEILENMLGLTPTFSRVSEGIYQVDFGSPIASTTNKIGFRYPSFTTGSQIDETAMRISVYDITTSGFKINTGDPVDGYMDTVLFFPTLFEVVVKP